MTQCTYTLYCKIERLQSAILDDFFFILFFAFLCISSLIYKHHHTLMYNFLLPAPSQTVNFIQLKK